MHRFRQLSTELLETMYQATWPRAATTLTPGVFLHPKFLGMSKEVAEAISRMSSASWGLTA